MKTLLILASLILPLAARPLSFEWTAQPASGFTVHVREPGGEWVAKGDTTTPNFTGDFPDGVFEVAVSAFKDLIGGDANSRVESEKCPSLTIPLTPEVPKGLRLKITIDLETSDNLTEWRNVASISFPESAAPKQFFRLTH